MAQFTTKNPAAVALIAATVKTLMYLKAGSQLGIDISSFWIQFDGVTPTNVDVLVELVRATSDATGGTARTPTSMGSIADGDTSYVTAIEAPTGGAASGDVLYAYLIPPTSGIKELIPAGDEIQVAKNERIFLRATAPNAVNAMAGLTHRE